MILDKINWPREEDIDLDVCTHEEVSRAVGFLRQFIENGKHLPRIDSTDSYCRLSYLMDGFIDVFDNTISVNFLWFTAFLWLDVSF